MIVNKITILFIVFFVFYAEQTCFSKSVYKRECTTKKSQGNELVPVCHKGKTKFVDECAASNLVEHGVASYGTCEEFNNIVLTAYAGEDIFVEEGDLVNIIGEGSVVEGNYLEEDLIYTWDQIGGEKTFYEFSSPPLFVDTAGSLGELIFQLTVETTDGKFFSTDEVIINSSSRSVPEEELPVVIDPVIEIPEWSIYRQDNVSHQDVWTYTPDLLDYQDMVFIENVKDSARPIANLSSESFVDSAWIIRCFLTVDEPIDVYYELGGDDGHSLFVNGEFIEGGPVFEIDTGVFTLNTGDNIIEAMLYNGEYVWNLNLYSRDLDGNVIFFSDIPGVIMTPYEQN